MSNELEAAAKAYVSIPLSGPEKCQPIDDLFAGAFLSGAEWAIRNAHEVKALVEALEKITDTMDADTHIPKMAIAEKALVAYRKSLGEE